MEAIQELGFLFIGLGFLLLVVTMIQRDHIREREWRISDAREFGFEETKRKKERHLPFMK